jgi:hypothetical protein
VDYFQDLTQRNSSTWLSNLKPTKAGSIHDHHTKQTGGTTADDPFGAVTEWGSEADRRAYGEHKNPWGGREWPALRKAGRLEFFSHCAFGKPMRVQIQLRIVTDDDTVLSKDVIACFDKGDDQLEEIGLSLDQAKTVLAGAQVSLVAAASFLARHRCCERCGRHLQSKERCRLLWPFRIPGAGKYLLQ